MQILLVLLKLEVYFFVAFCLVYGFIDVHYAIPEFPITMALIPTLLILMVLTILSIKHENMVGAAVVMVCRVLFFPPFTPSYTRLTNEQIVFEIMRDRIHYQPVHCSQRRQLAGQNLAHG
jgi:hypothetical protein